MQGNQHIPQAPPTSVPRPATLSIPTSANLIDPNGTTTNNNPRPQVSMPIVHYIIRPSNLPGVPGRAIQFNSLQPGPRGPTQTIRLSNVGSTPTILSPQSIALPRHPTLMSPRATILGQQVIRAVPGQPTAILHPGVPTSQTLSPMPHGAMPSQFVIRPPNNYNTTATIPSQMNPDEILRKGINLLNCMITKCTSDSSRVATRNLIKELIEERKTPEEFAIALHEDTNDSSTRNSLVAFLNRFLPHLRHAVRTGKTTIPGVEIRPADNIDGPLGGNPVMFAVQPQLQNPPAPLSFTHPPMNVQSTNEIQPPPAKKKKVPLPPGTKSAYAIKKEAREAKKKAKEESMRKTDGSEEEVSIKIEKTEKIQKPKTEKSKRPDKQKKQEKLHETLSTTLRDDDDVNDVAAMGGVNLAEETQRILAASSEIVGTQIRSCKEELFLDAKSLSKRVARITAKYDLPEPSHQVVSMISHATQERLKNIVERLGVLAQQRCENLKFNQNYEVSYDIKGQMKFLAELDRIEKKRSEEQEREFLLRVAKSRSKIEDPEQIKLRQRAKDMQRAEQEEERQREANETALLAIGPRKKLMSDDSSFPPMNRSYDSSEIKPDRFRKTKRVNMKDLLALFELDRSNMHQLIRITSKTR